MRFIAPILILLLTMCGKTEDASAPPAATPWTAAQKTEYTAACKLRIAASNPNRDRYCACLQAIGETKDYDDFKANEFNRLSESPVEYQKCLDILAGT